MKKLTKKTIKSSYLIIAFFLAFISCFEEDMPVPNSSTQAKFKVEVKNNGIAPATVYFINQSVNAANYLWRFGTGDTLYTTDKDTISYVYENAGTYTASLTVYSNNADLYYNNLYAKKTIIISSIPVKRLYFTDRNDNKVKYVILNSQTSPIIEEFESTTLNKPYGMVMDTINAKLYVTDYGEQVLNRYDWDGNKQEILMNSSTDNFNSPIGIIVVDDKIYWGEPGGIHCANLDGSSPSVYISVPGEYPQDITYDYINHVFYFTNDLNPESGGVWKVNFDGSNLTEIVPEVWGGAIEVNPENNRLYYYVGYEGMYICELDGSNPVLFDSSNAGKWAWGMVVDNEGAKIYYPNRVEMTIMRANLDGSDVEIFIPSSANINPNAMTIDTYR